MKDFKKIPKKYQPAGFEIIHEDLDLIVGNKAAGFLSVAALWNKADTIQSALDEYVKKGNSKSKKVIHVVHRLDQATSGVMIYAKTPEVQNFLKDNWLTTQKTYFAIIHGKMTRKVGRIESYLSEDEEYVVTSNDNEEGKIAKTEYEVLKESANHSLVKVNLLTGRKNQIRVHFADLGHPLVGDGKYGPGDKRYKSLALHSRELTITHPHTKKRMTFVAKVPAFFNNLVPYDYDPAVPKMPSKPGQPAVQTAEANPAVTPTQAAGETES